MVKSVAVFCASSTKVDKAYFDVAFQTGKILSDAGKTIYYGGGSVGLMGAVAEAALLNNGKIIGVIPEFMMAMEWGNKNVDELVIVPDMFERKKVLIEKTDAIIVLPGGVGTVDELFDAITQKQLCRHKSPIIIMNINGFFDSLIEMLNRMIIEQFMRIEHGRIYTIINSPEELVEKMMPDDEWDLNSLSSAQI
jgi:uncharacterized protein (TIGR00730 family)